MIKVGKWEEETTTTDLGCITVVTAPFTPQCCILDKVSLMVITSSHVFSLVLYLMKLKSLCYLPLSICLPLPTPSSSPSLPHRKLPELLANLNQ